MKIDRPMVSVVIPTFHRPVVLERTLSSIARVTYPGPFEVLVIDDGPSESTKQVVQRMQANFPVSTVQYVAQQNAGAARARNRGAQEARGDVLIFLDDDMLIQADHLDRHVEHLGSSGRKRIVNGDWQFAPEVQEELRRSPFGRFRLWLDDWMRSGIPIERLSDDLLRPSMVTACNLGIRREHFIGLGGFDESFPAAGYEDQELSLRARNAGFDFVYDKRIALSHLDQWLTLDDFSRRVRQGAFTAGIMAQKYPNDFGASPLIYENSDAFGRDGARGSFKRLLKQAGTTRIGRSAFRLAIVALERVAPKSALLHTAYWKWCGIWIYIGVRQGLAVAVPPREP